MPLPFAPPGLPRGLGVVVFLSVLFAAVAAGAYPVVRRLTRRLESLKKGVERFGAGQLDHRVEVTGRDEVAAVAASFNHAAARVEALVEDAVPRARASSAAASGWTGPATSTRPPSWPTFPTPRAS